MLLDKLKTREDRLWYAAKVTEHNWSRNILVMQIESRLMDRSGTAVTNFALTLPKPQSDLALGVAEYQLVESLPAEFQTSLPSIEQIERELAGIEFPEKEDEV